MNDVALLLQRVNRYLAAYRIQVFRVSHIIFQVIQMTLLIPINHLLRREHRLRLRIPVYHAETTINESLPVEIDKHFQHTLASFLVHRERRSVPITRCTQPAQLLQNDATVLIRPSPRMLQKLLTGEVTLLDALFRQTVHHLRLRRNRRMVRSRHPTCVLAVNARLPNQDVLNRVVQHVPHVENTRHVRWWNHNCVWFTPIRFACKQFVVHPVLIPLALHLRRAIIFC